MTSAIVIGLVIVQRLSELVLARRNTARLISEGAHEVGAAHYPAIVAVHVVWLISVTIWSLMYPEKLSAAWLAAYVTLQPFRIWTMATLGRYWTTRIIVVPSAPIVRHGPYRFCKHPNYAVVVAEIAVLPLAFGAWPLAIILSALNAAVLAVRITAENRSLAERAASMATPPTTIQPAPQSSAKLR